jgi:hypothetical protein
MKKLLLIALLSGSIASAWGAARPELEAAESRPEETRYVLKTDEIRMLKFREPRATIIFTNATSHVLQLQLATYNPFFQVGWAIYSQGYPHALGPGESYESLQYAKATDPDINDVVALHGEVIVKRADDSEKSRISRDYFRFLRDKTRSITFVNDNLVPLKFRVRGYNTSQNVSEELLIVLQPGQRYAVTQYFTDDNQFIVTAVTIENPYPMENPVDSQQCKIL